MSQQSVLDHVGLCHTLDIILKHGFLYLINKRALRDSLEPSANINHLPEHMLLFGLGIWPHFREGWAGGEAPVHPTRIANPFFNFFTEDDRMNQKHGFC